MKSSWDLNICSSQWPFSGVKWPPFGLSQGHDWKKLQISHEKSALAPGGNEPGRLPGLETVGKGVVVRGLCFQVKLGEFWLQVNQVILEDDGTSLRWMCFQFLLPQEWIPGPGNDHVSSDPRQKLLSRWFFEAFSQLVGYLSSVEGNQKIAKGN